MRALMNALAIAVTIIGLLAVYWFAYQQCPNTSKLIACPKEETSNA